MRIDLLKLVREATPVFGALLIGFAFGLSSIGVQLNPECVLIAGEPVGAVCQTLAWGDRWALLTVFSGAGLIAVSIIAEWRLQEDGRNA